MRQAAPKGCEQAIAPVNNQHMTAMVNSIGNSTRYTLRTQHHGIMEITSKQVGVDKAWPNIGDADIESSLSGLLL